MALQLRHDTARSSVEDVHLAIHARCRHHCVAVRARVDRQDTALQRGYEGLGCGPYAQIPETQQRSMNNGTTVWHAEQDLMHSTLDLTLITVVQHIQQLWSPASRF